MKKVKGKVVPLTLLDLSTPTSTSDPGLSAGPLGGPPGEPSGGEANNPAGPSNKRRHMEKSGGISHHACSVLTKASFAPGHREMHMFSSQLAL